MSEETPSVEQTREDIEALLALVVTQLGAQVEGKTKKQRIQCPGCATVSMHDVQIVDTDMLVKALSALSAAAPRLQSKDDASSLKATKIIVDLAALSSAELAERIVVLEEEINAKDYECPEAPHL